MATQTDQVSTEPDLVQHTGTREFSRRLPLSISAQTLYDWHARPGAFERLAPPWEDIEVVHKAGGIEDGAQLIMKIKKGPFKLTWEALHQGHVPGAQFQDQQVRGPFGFWLHTHRFEEREGGSMLHDHVQYRLPVHPLGQWFGGWFARRMLDQMFTHRHHRTQADLMRHQAFADQRPLTVVIAGASGLVGSALTPFLTTGGHSVRRLVRRPAAGQGVPENTEHRWDPAKGELDPSIFEGVDAVICLSGAGVADKRWSPDRKRVLVESRTDTVGLIARTLAELKAQGRPCPQTFIAASAIGYYGFHRDDHDAFSEADAPGEDFLARLCVDWEKAAEPARDAGIRVVTPRIGVVMSPKGGALGKLLTPFKLGGGGPVGHGGQMMSWIALDDLVGLIHFALLDERVEGPVNAVAPNPVTSREFARTLGRVLKRPAIIPAPAFAIKAAFGEMGETVLLHGQRVKPQALIDAGFQWQHPHLEDALRHELGLIQ
ncbi:MAG: TIGR01777 family oxidoreductase [Bradymonadia bacterium]